MALEPAANQVYFVHLPHLATRPDLQWRSVFTQPSAHPAEAWTKPRAMYREISLGDTARPEKLGQPLRSQIAAQTLSSLQSANTTSNIAFNSRCRCLRTAVALVHIIAHHGSHRHVLRAHHPLPRLGLVHRIPALSNETCQAISTAPALTPTPGASQNQRLLPSGITPSPPSQRQRITWPPASQHQLITLSPLRPHSAPHPHPHPAPSETTPVPHQAVPGTSAAHPSAIAARLQNTQLRSCTTAMDSGTLLLR